MDQASPLQGHEVPGEHGSGGRTAPAAGAGVQLRPFGPDHLPLAQPWFADPDTQVGVGNYLIATPSELGNYKIVDTARRMDEVFGRSSVRVPCYEGGTTLVAAARNSQGR